MIERYCTKEMNEIWSEEAKYQRWVLVEQSVNDTLIQHQKIPPNNLSNLLKNISAQLLVLKAKEIEAEISHDVNAFVFACEDLCGSEGRWVHYGLTSNDIVDTANALAIKQSTSIIKNELLKINYAVWQKEQPNANIKIIARTHGRHAEITNLSNVFHLWSQDINDCLGDLDKRIPGKISGAVGDYKFISKAIERDILNKLELSSCASNQIVSRINHAKLMSSLVAAASILEKIALQIRLYQQSGIDEMYEPFGAKQTGSSAMPHKRNPIKCENICGLARVMRGYLSPVFEDIALWQERDISHSSVERIIIPDAFNLLHYMSKNMLKIIDGLQINYEIIQNNINNFIDDGSQKKLLNLVGQGMSRQEAYRIIQKK